MILFIFNIYKKNSTFFRLEHFTECYKNRNHKKKRERGMGLMSYLTLEAMHVNRILKNEIKNM